MPSHVFSQIIHTGWLEAEALAEQNKEWSEHQLFWSGRQLICSHASILKANGISEQWPQKVGVFFEPRERNTAHSYQPWGWGRGGT